MGGGEIQGFSGFTGFRVEALGFKGSWRSFAGYRGYIRVPVDVSVTS